jgi:hypothetical protein
MAHVIQLSLKSLLATIKGNPENEQVDIVWSDDRLGAIKASHIDIANTLTKARTLAIYINASSQRKDAFTNLQNRATPLALIQDVKTRWNSTYLMLQRAKRLRSTLDIYCLAHKVDKMKLNSEEWRQIDYLLCLTKPFFKYTTSLSKTKDVTIHWVFKLYNELFRHLEASITQLRRKRSISRLLYSHFRLNFCLPLL